MYIASRTAELQSDSSVRVDGQMMPWESFAALVYALQVSCEQCPDASKVIRFSAQICTQVCRVQVAGITWQQSHVDRGRMVAGV